MTIPAPLQGPFCAADLAPVPPGWELKPGPDFVAVGCGKSGSTWWSSLVLDHPQVVPNRLGWKELHYFSHFDYRGPSAGDTALYRQAFAAPPGCLSGEWTATYLYFPLTLQYLAEAAPETRIIALLRNPVERSFSTFNQLLRGRARILGAEGAPLHVLRTFSLFPEALQSGLLAHGVRLLLELFDRRQILVLQYERMRQDPAAELARTYRFLGLDDRHAPAQLHRKVNDHPHALPRPDSHQRARLVQYFRPDVEQLFQLLPELDPAFWPEFERVGSVARRTSGRKAPPHQRSGASGASS